MSHFFSSCRRGAALAVSLVVAVGAARAQSVGVGTTAPHSSAALDVSSTGKGLLPPRLTQGQRDAISSPAAGLQVFNTTTGRLNVFDGVRWTEALLLPVTPTGALPDTTVFAYTGGPQTYVVPAGTNRLRVIARGAAGGVGSGGGAAGRGAQLTADLAVTPGQTLQLNVGGYGGHYPNTLGGYNGGAPGGAIASGGGGASDVRVGGYSLTERIVVAGGGGGSGSFFANIGGDGGLPLGGNAYTAVGPGYDGGGKGATQSSGGAGGSDVNNPAPNGATGTFGAGGAGGTVGGGGGGGGGYFGGGGGYAHPGNFGGGGGSSWVSPARLSGAVVYAAGDNGHGQITIITLDPVAAPAFDASNLTNFPSAAGDNLGTHVATQDVQLGANRLLGTIVRPNDVGLSFNADGRARLNAANTGSANWIALDAGGTAGDRVVAGFLGGRATVAGHSFGLTAWADLALNPGGGRVGIGVTNPTELLHVGGSIRMADAGDLRLRSADSQHGLGWYGTGKLWNAQAVDGPVLYGWAGGALGVTSANNRRTVVSWNDQGRVGINTDAPAATLHVSGATSTVRLDGQLRLNDTNDLFIRSGSDLNHGLGWYGTGKLWNAQAVDGPVLYGWGGGALGSTASGGGGRKSILTWTWQNRVGIGSDATVPQATLHVGGATSTVRFDGLAGAGTRLLTVDAAGNLAAQAQPTLSLTGQNLSISNGNTIALPSGDNLGNHTATQTLALGTHGLTGAATGTAPVTGLTLTGTGQTRISTPNPGTGYQDWIGLSVGGAVGDRLVAGLFDSIPAIGAHNQALNAWRDLLVNPGGRVGVGVARATADLDVGGTVRLRTLTGAGSRLLVADANGRLSAPAYASLNLQGGALTVNSADAYAATIGTGPGTGLATYGTVTSGVGQSFTLPATATITRIDVYGGSGTGTFRLWQGEPGTGTVQRTQPVTYSGTSGLSGNLTAVVLATPYAIPAAGIYAFSTGIGGPFEVGARTYGGGHLFDNATPITSSQLRFTVYYTVAAVPLLIASGSRVGVGTSTPTATLDVNGDLRVRALSAPGAVITDATGTLSRAALGSSVSGSNVTISLGPATSTTFAAPGDNLGTHTATQNLSLGTYQLVGNGGTSGLALGVGGDVGIGTATPGARLDVRGTGGLRAYTTNDGSAGSATDWFSTFGGQAGTAMSRVVAGTLFGVATVGGHAFGAANGVVGWAPLALNPGGGNVGIGTSAPVTPLHVVAGASNVVLGRFAAAGGFGMIQVNNGAVSVDLGATAGQGFAGTGTGGDFVLRTASLNRVMIKDGTGNVGIGTDAPAEKLHVVGNAYVTGNVGIAGTLQYCGGLVACSDRRYKKNITPLQSALANVTQLSGYTYFWRRDEFKEKNFTADRQIGFIAQEIEALYPEMVFTDPTSGYKAVDYARMTPVLLEALKELKAQLDEQTRRAGHAEAALSSFEARLRALEAGSGQAREAR